MMERASHLVLIPCAKHAPQGGFPSISFSNDANDIIDGSLGAGGASELNVELTSSFTDPRHVAVGTGVSPLSQRVVPG